MPGVDITWEPNAPDATLISDDLGRGALALKAHPSDSDQRTVVLRFDLVIYSVMTPPNDEGLNHHPLYDRGLKGLLWLGVVRLILTQYDPPRPVTAGSAAPAAAGPRAAGPG